MQAGQCHPIIIINQARTRPTLPVNGIHERCSSIDVHIDDIAFDSIKLIGQCYPIKQSKMHSMSNHHYRWMSQYIKPLLTMIARQMFVHWPTMDVWNI